MQYRFTVPMGPNSLPVLGVQLDKRHANRTSILRWNGMTDTEHNGPYERRIEVYEDDRVA